MMVSSPFPSSSRTTGETSIIEDMCPDEFIRSKWTLESDFPSTTTIEISSEIDEKTRKYFEVFFYYIYQISLPYSPELEKDVTMKQYFILYHFNIPIIPESSLSEIISTIFSISELCEPLSDCWIKVSICFRREFEHI